MAANGAQENNPEFMVMIVACAPVPSTMITAILVAQPQQQWHVFRTHEDFLALGKALEAFRIPQCPVLGDTSNIDGITKQRNNLQQWLMAVLTNPDARNTPATEQFLISGFDQMPVQYNDAVWTQFNVVQQSHNQEQSHSKSGGGVDAMDMEMMFEDGEDAAPPGPYNQEEEEEEFVSPAERYKPINENVPFEDEMEFNRMAGEVEMVDDIGSLAQSMGASYLGRSLQLQAEMGSLKPVHEKPKEQKQGLNVGGAAGRPPVGGGLAKMVAEAEMHNNVISDSRKPKPSLRTGLDAFSLIRVIGKGSFGKVFLVKEKSTDEILALKVLKKDNIVKRNQVEHTKTERNVMGYINHPFIVSMRMAFQSKDKLYFVLDFCAGGELFYHLGKTGKFPETRARFYTAEILLAISYVHSLGIVYRDLKPENVLLDAEGHIRLTDFGLSKEGITASSSGAWSFCGTPEYLAPEILDRKGHGRAVDWWSLGALLYEMLTSLPPFYSQDRERLFEKIRRSELTYPNTVSRTAKALLKGLLTKDPSRRLGSGPNDAEDIKPHEFFKSIDWDALYEGRVTPPWRPDVRGAADTSQFDREFTNMPIMSPQSMRQGHFMGGTPQDNHFEGFSFVDHSFSERLRRGTGIQN